MMPAPMTAIEALAEALASIDGRFSDQPVGELYMTKAAEMIKRLKARGYVVVPQQPTPEMIAAMEAEIRRAIFTDGSEDTGDFAVYEPENPAASYLAAVEEKA